MNPTVLLVNPNRLRPPIAPVALDYISDSLAARGIDHELLDLCFESNQDEAIARSLRNSEPSLIAVTLRNTDDCYLASSQDFLPEVARIIATIRRHSSARIVVGGSGYSVSPRAILTKVDADYGILGDGEQPLAMLASTMLAKQDISTIPGLVWRERGGFRQNAPWVGPLDRLPARRRLLLDNGRYFEEGGQAGIETKRGCCHRCIYCADPVGKGRRVRVRTPAQVAEEFESLLAQGIEHFHLCDSEFNVPAYHALAVCEELIRQGIGERSRWYTYAKPGAFTVELARAMRRAGCVGVNFGADSGDDRMLDALGRDFRAADLWETAVACRDAGLVLMYDLLLGGPGETQDSMANTIELIKRISPDRAGVSLGVRIYAGTRLSQLVWRQGPMQSNPNLQGQVENNPEFSAPIFFLSASLGEDPVGYVRKLIGGDQRFFFPTTEAGTEAYNYSDNERLVEAVKRGYRGAYWDILRRLNEGNSVR